MINGQRTMTRRRQQPKEMEWSRYGTREISHEEEKRRTLPIRDEKWLKSHEGSSLEK